MSKRVTARRLRNPSAASLSRAFTLVELLVVIGVIAVLISILLPALNKARRQANTVQCASNMRQIAIAVLNYCNDNGGHLIPAMIDATGSTPNPRGGPPNLNSYADGWFWAAELVHQHYISAPLLVTPAGTTTPNPPSSVSSVFACPEAYSPDETQSLDNGGPYNYGAFPTDLNNNEWSYDVDSVDTAKDGRRNDGAVCYGVATWYQLNCREVGFTSNYTIGGPFNPPFVSFDPPSPVKIAGETTLGDLTNANYSRTLSMIRHSALMVMLGETSTINWLNQTVQNGHYATRMGARHGQRTADRTNAYTNFAFMDGHVDLVPTYPIDSMGPPANNPGTDGMGAMPQSSGTVFTLWEDHQ